jgi:hypothetical protein
LQAWANGGPVFESGNAAEAALLRAISPSADAAAAAAAAAATAAAAAGGDVAAAAAAAAARRRSYSPRGSSPRSGGGGGGGGDASSLTVEAGGVMQLGCAKCGEALGSGELTWARHGPHVGLRYHKACRDLPWPEPAQVAANTGACNSSKPHTVH